jgi:biopolymer transport protein ExbD
MPLLKKRQRGGAEIPTSSMADIAFLLLIFFLVTTTIDTDTGIYMELPPKLEEDVTPPEIPDRNILMVLVSQDGRVLIEGEESQLNQIRPYVKRFITNEGRDPGLSDSPQKGVVSFKTERNAKYEMYVEVLDEIKMGFNEVRDEAARAQGAPDYETFRANYAGEGKDPISDKYPTRISIAEPDATNPAL